MSFCNLYPIKEHQSLTSSEYRTTVTLHDEIHWGRSYRHKKKIQNLVPIPPKKAPTNIPFKICREKLELERRVHRASCKSKKTKVDTKRPTLLEMSVMSQEQYMNYLSTPRKIEKPPPKKEKCRCEIEPCPPRCVQLAVPNKRRVFENWKSYHDLLPTEVILRYEQILHTDKNLEPSEARHYYKKIDRTRKRQFKEKQRLEKKKEVEREKGDKAWLTKQIDLTTNAIVDSLREKPLFTLNYRQVMLSDGILDILDKINLLRKPSRKSKNHYEKVIVELSDKSAVWIDALTRFIDVQPIDSEEDIAPLTISSMEGEDTEVEEDEEEEEEEEEEDEEADEEEKKVKEEEEAEEEGDEEGEEEIQTKFLFKEGENLLNEIEELEFEAGEMD